jgi:hypothetical protein
MARFASTGGGLMPMPSRVFVPTAELLLAPAKGGQEALPCKTGPAMLERRGSSGTRAAALCSNNCAKSVVQACSARASGLCASRRFKSGGSEAAERAQKAQQPTARPESHSQREISLPPSEPAEHRKALRPCAQHTSSTDLAQLPEPTVAKPVLCNASRSGSRREPEAKRRAGRSGADSLVTFLDAQDGHSPAGPRSPLGLARTPAATEAMPCL